jgi:hypothetical protein
VRDKRKNDAFKSIKDMNADFCEQYKVRMTKMKSRSFKRKEHYRCIQAQFNDMTIAYTREVEGL